MSRRDFDEGTRRKRRLFARGGVGRCRAYAVVPNEMVPCQMVRSHNGVMQTRYSIAEPSKRALTVENWVLTVSRAAVGLVSRAY